MVNAIKIICPILVWACVFSIMFVENTTTKMYIIGFEFVVFLIQIATLIYSSRKRKKQKF